MFRWTPKKTPELTREEKARAVALDATSRYGEILERGTALIYDVSALPLPKADMKHALKYAWRVAPSDEVRDAIQACFVLLGQFQEGVGSTPIEGVSPTDAEEACKDKDAMAAYLRRRLPEWELLQSWMAKSQAEMLELAIEFDQFKKEQRGK